MKSYTFAGLGGAILTFAVAVFAGPEPLEKTVAPAQPTEIDWAGPYLGVNVGAVWTNFDVSKYATDVDLEDQFYQAVAIPGTFVSEASFPVDGRHATETDAIGGGQVGYNFQFGRFVTGIEGGFSGINSKTSGKGEGFQINPLGFRGIIQLGELVAETTFDSWRIAETNWNGYVGGHVGFAWGRFLFYGNGGAAFTNIDVTAIDQAHTDFFEECDGKIICDGNIVQPAQPVDSGGIFLGGVTNTKRSHEHDTLTGWYTGGGVSYAVNDVVRAGIEYRHCGFGDETFNFRSSGPVFPGRTNFDLDSDQLTFRVNIMLGHFGH